MLDRFPDLLKFIRDQIEKRQAQPYEVHEARISWRDLHTRVKKWLAAKGVGKNEYPFNMVCEGYNSFIKLFGALAVGGGARAYAARGGRDAARRSRIGRGFVRLLPVLVNYQEVQLDFAKEDAQTIIVVIDTPTGGEIEVVCTRWWVGVLVEFKSEAILSLFISLEWNPTADCVLETIELGLVPAPADESLKRLTVTSDGLVAPNQLIPELAFVGFSTLLVDNAWSMSATDVVENVIETVGCAFCFGEVRGWWAREAAEHVIQKLAQRGAQRLPSTMGAGPADTRRDEPAAQAVRYRVTIQELANITKATARWLNEKRTEGRDYNAPLKLLQLAVEDPSKGFIPARLPRARQADTRLLWHVEIRVVCGRRPGRLPMERPYVRIARARCTNEVLADRWDLIGKKLKVYVSRRNCNVMRAIVLSDGEDLGLLVTPKRWRQAPCTWRDRRYINSRGKELRESDGAEDPVQETLQELTKELQVRSRKAANGRKRAAKQAVPAARLQQSINRRSRAPKAPEQGDAAQTPQQSRRRLNLPSPPKFKPFLRGRR